MEKEINGALKCAGKERPVPGWEEILVAERLELLKRTIKLKKYMGSSETKLNETEWAMLHNQYRGMVDYLQALTDRCVYYGLIDGADLGIHY